MLKPVGDTPLRLLSNKYYDGMAVNDDEGNAMKIVADENIGNVKELLLVLVKSSLCQAK